MPVRSKADDVLEITELLELIILELPIKPILNVSRVSRRWKDVVDGSILIKRKLFLAPQGAVVDPEPDELKRHRDHQYMLPRLELNTLLEGSNIDAQRSPQDPFTPFWNADKRYGNWLNADMTPYQPVCLKRFGPSPRTATTSKKDIRESWRSMYISKPPISKIRVEICPCFHEGRPYQLGPATFHFCPGARKRTFLVENRRGITFGWLEYGIIRAWARVHRKISSNRECSGRVWINFTVNGKIETGRMSECEPWWMRTGINWGIIWGESKTVESF